MPIDVTDPQDVQETWRKRIRQAQQAQQALHGTWASNLAFAAGQQWLVWDKQFKRLRHIQDVDPKYAGKELFTADRIFEFRQAALGELTSDDDRPQLLTAQEGEDAEQVAQELNRLVGFAWEREWNAADVLLQARRYCVDLGVSAIRCRWEPNAGAVQGHAPIGADGHPIQDPQVVQALTQTGQMPDGSLPQFKPVREGRTVWDAYSAFQLLTPPGVAHEDQFPWEIVARPVPVDELQDSYGAAVKEDSDIVSTAGLVAQVQAQSAQQTVGSRLRDHAWLYTCFQRPSSKYPEGRQASLAGSGFQLVDASDELPYTLAKEPHTGIVYLHWGRLSDRFHSRSLVESLKDPQRVINRRKTQNVEIFDRGMAKLFVRKGDFPGDLTGAPLEIVELDRNAQPPVPMNGITPSPAMYQDIESLDEDMSHASTLSPLRLGENPQNVQTYGQLAILNDSEQGKRSTIISEHRKAAGVLVELSISDVQRYWPEEKQALVDGENDEVQRITFKKSRIPAEYRVKAATGQPLPRSQGAQIKKIDAIWLAALQCHVAEQDPAAWTGWYRESLEAGSAQDLPVVSPSSQQQLARLENMLMRQGEDVAPAHYDELPQHLPVHREEEDQARAQGDVELAARIERHLQASVQMAAIASRAWRQVDPANPEAAADLALDEAQTIREHQMLIGGVPLNPEELQETQAMLQQGINPETGSQFLPQEMADPAMAQNLKQMLDQASLKPKLSENLQVHLDRHGKIINSEMFDKFPPDVRQRFLTHFNLTRELWLSLPQMPEKIDSPKVTLSLRESVGPSTVAKVLYRAGVPDADVQALATEPPMENTVRSDVLEPSPQGQQAAQQATEEAQGVPPAPPAQPDGSQPAP